MQNSIIKRIIVKILSQSSTPQRMVSSTTFATKPYKLHRFAESPSTQVTLNSDDALILYRKMATIRRIEAAASALSAENFIHGYCHLYSGQEAVAVGIESAIRKSDTAISAYRSHGWAYVRGAPVKSILAETTGKISGCGRGKGGSMHLYCDGLYGGNAIVGSVVPLGSGLAFAHKYRRSDAISVTIYGDGAANQGQVFEAFNMAKLWSLPVIFLCENNRYAMGMSLERSSASTDFYTRGDYVPGLWVDGMDVLAVRQAARYLVERCRAGDGPFILEAETYRYNNHHNREEDISYRTEEEVQKVKQFEDPIELFRSKIVGSELVTNDELNAIDLQLDNEIAEAFEFAKSEPEVTVDELYADVYANSLEDHIRGITYSERHKHKNIQIPRNIRADTDTDTADKVRNTLRAYN